MLFALLEDVKPDTKSGEYYLTDVVASLVKRGLRVESYLAPDAHDCLGINTREDLVLAEEIMQKRIKGTLIKAGVTIVDPANTYIESDVNIGQDTIIHPFTVIRSGVIIGRFCHVGPFSQLRPGTVLNDYAEVGNFTEVKQSRLGKHSKAKHLSYLGDALIGSDVNIGAGTITANYDGCRKHQTIIDNGASTGSGTVLVAPVRLGKKSFTGAGAIVTKGKNVPAGTTVVGMPAQPLLKKHITKRKR
jgi:bifunctional UDP-N-acetylglucosamine pyrophosphorylase/glucosamine-1-phosphate N-acetyltransferase